MVGFDMVCGFIYIYILRSCKVMKFIFSKWSSKSHRRAMPLRMRFADTVVQICLFFICSNLFNLKGRGVVECNLYVCFSLGKKEKIVSDFLCSIQRSL